MLNTLHHLKYNIGYYIAICSYNQITYENILLRPNCIHRQSRYVGYYEKVVLANRLMPHTPTLRITDFTLTGMTGVGTSTGSELTISVGSRDSMLPYRCSFATAANCMVSDLLGIV